MPRNLQFAGTRHTHLVPGPTLAEAVDTSESNSIYKYNPLSNPSRPLITNYDGVHA
jgi:hypothetical protein